MAEHIIGARREDVMRVSAEDARASDLHSEAPPGRHFLRTTLVSTLYPENRPKIIQVDTSDPAAIGFKALVDHKILSVPVYNSRKDHYVGFLDTLDMVCVVMDSLGESDFGRFGEMLESSDKLKKLSCGQIVDLSGRNPWYPVEASASISAAIRTMAQQKVHRVPIIDSGGHLETMVTQSHIVSLLHRNSSIWRASGRTVEQMKLGYKDVLSIRSNKRTIDAFRLIYENKVTGVAVVDENGKLVGNISASDLRNVGWDGQFMSRLFLPITEYFAQVNVDLKGAHNVTPNDTFKHVLEVLNSTKSHRVYVINEDNVPIGVISLSDVLEVVARTDC